MAVSRRGDVVLRRTRIYIIVVLAALQTRHAVNTRTATILQQLVHKVMQINRRHVIHDDTCTGTCAAHFRIQLLNVCTCQNNILYIINARLF